MWDEHIRPTGFLLDQPGANWILTDVCELFGEAFVVTQAMVEEISLPFYAAELCSNSLEVANQL